MTHLAKANAGPSAARGHRRTWRRGGCAHGLLAICGLAAAVACLGSCHRKSAGPELSRFLGTWEVGSGTLTLDCSTKEHRTLPVTAPIVFVPGTDSPLLDANPVCPLKYDVSGNVATALAGQTCPHPQIVTRLKLAVTTFTTADGATGALESSGRQDGFIDIKMGWPVNCTFSESARYRRVGAASPP